MHHPIKDQFVKPPSECSFGAVSPEHPAAKALIDAIPASTAIG
jgi:hypothetical protein